MAVNNRDIVLSYIAIALEVGASPDERLSALGKADALRRTMKASWRKLGVDPGLVEKARENLADVSALPEEGTEAADVSRRPVASGSSSRSLGIGVLARSLIVEHPDWTYRRIAEEVNARIAGAYASEKSVRWYSHKMRKAGIAGAGRHRPAKIMLVKQPAQSDEL